jgi:hypothetical protein
MTMNRNVDAKNQSNLHWAELSAPSSCAKSIASTTQPGCLSEQWDELSLPPQVSEINDASVVATATSPQHASHTIMSVLAATACSNNTYSLIGNLLITSNLSFGMVLHLACAGLAIANEMRVPAARSDNMSPSESSDYKSISRWIVSTFKSPGIYRTSLGVAFTMNALEATGRGLLIQTVAFAWLAFGNFGAARVVNHSNSAVFSNPSCGIESETAPDLFARARAVWTLCTNPGLAWGVADLVVGLSGVRNRDFASPFTIVSIGCSLAAITYALIKGKAAERSPTPLCLNAATNFSFALTNLTLGSPLIAATLALWGTGSLIIAGNQLRQLRRESAPRLTVKSNRGDR